MVHSDVSTAGRSWGRVAAGGLRLAQQIDQVVNKMQQESSSPSTPSICFSLSLVRDFLVRRACTPCPGTLVARFEITTQSIVHDGNFPLGSQQACLHQDSARGRVSDCEFDATDASMFCFDLQTPWPLSTNPNSDSLWRLLPRELLSSMPG